MSWLNRTADNFVPRMSPSDMAGAFPNDAPFIDGEGVAASNAAWIFSPDLTAVAGFDVKYWVRQASPVDTVTLKNQAARDAVDAAEAQAAIDADRLEAKAAYDRRDLKGFALAVLDEFNILRAQHSLNARTEQQLKAAHSNKVDAI